MVVKKEKKREITRFCLKQNIIEKEKKKSKTKRFEKLNLNEYVYNEDVLCEVASDVHSNTGPFQK